MKLFKSSCVAIAAGAIMLLSASGGGGSSSAGAQPDATPTPAPASTPSFSIGGGVAGLNNASGLTLVNGSETLAVAPQATAFTFANKVAQNGTYNVTIGSQPAGTTCSVSNGKGTVVSQNISSISVQCAPAQDNAPFTVSTFAGDDGQTLVDGVGASARFGTPYAIVKDSAGNFYVSDTGSNTIRRISPSGAVSTLALIGGSPRGLAMDASDNLYVADSRNDRVLKIPPNGVVSTLAGSSGDYGYVDGPASVARFSSPQGVAVDSAGNVYVSDGWDEFGSFYHRIRKITPSGLVSTLAGGSTAGFVDGDGAAARFSSPGQLTVDSAGNVYVADEGNTAIRKVTPSGQVSTVIGGPGAHGTENFDGVGSAARFGSISGIVLDGSGNLYVADTFNSSVRKITPAAVVSTVAGAAIYGTGGVMGFVDGSRAVARFRSPTGIVIDAAGNLQVVDRGNRAIRTVSPAGQVTTLAGQGPLAALIDGTGSAARFNTPFGVATDGAGNVYVAESSGGPIRRITPAGVVTTLPSGPDVGRSYLAADNAGNVYFKGGDGIRKMSPAGVVTTISQLGDVRGIAVDGAGTLYMTSKNSVIAMSSTGVVTTLAGNDSAGFADGLEAAARFNVPQGIAVDAAGNVYVADSKNNVIRKLSPQGQVTTLASGRLTNPTAVAVDGAGNVYVVADVIQISDSRISSELGGAVLKISSNGVVTFVAGTANGQGGRADGPGATARFNVPTGIAVDGAGNIYVADSYNSAIRKIVH